MKEIERRIYVSEEIFNNEYSYVYGENKDKEVTFAYYQIKKDKAFWGLSLYILIAENIPIPRR